MEDTPTTAVARRFLSLLDEGEAPSVLELAKALDELAIAYHQAPDVEPADDDSDPPREDYRARYPRLGKRFPNLGYYAVADPTEPINDEPLVGDAIDDLSDIAADLEEVLWRLENVGADDAHWYFRMLFEIHWGRHLRELQLYLHAKIQSSGFEETEG
jgi:hypothetical protein